MKIFLARQPIFDASLRVYGYELLHRSSEAGSFDCADSNAASLGVLANTLLTLGLENVLRGRLGFINFTRDLLLNEVALLMPPDSLVVEILESVEPDEQVIAACRKLRSRHYRLALDDFGPNALGEPLVEFASVLKVDFRASPESERREIVRRFGRPGLRMLAEKVETQEEVEWARREGFDYFQGYFFARPVILAQQEIPSFKVNLLRILSELYSVDFDFGRVESLIKQELPLCYRLLRYVNSAAFGSRSPIVSIRQALVLLGENEVRRWFTVAALPVLASDKPDELVETAMLRARFCELLAPSAGLSHRTSDAFLVGMFSLLDAMVGRPLDELLNELCLAGDVRGALLTEHDEANPLAVIYRLVVACERAKWEEVQGLAERFGSSQDSVSDLYLQAIRWCKDIFHPQPAHRGW